VRVFITGATGFIGRALVARLQRDRHTVVVWARSPGRARNLLGADVEILSVGAPVAALGQVLGRCDGIVNLAGESIAGKRWTSDRRRRMEQSRVQLTQSLVAALPSSGSRPGVLVSASAVGYYGDRADEVLTEDSTRGNDFLADLCSRWESAALGATALDLRVVLLRMGVVLGRAGGALTQMLPPFRLGLGGPIGSGRQFFPWIHLHDLVNVIAAALTDGAYSGPINAVAPQEATGRMLARSLGRALHRPAALPLPALALRAVFGESASVLLGSQRAVPKRLNESYAFAWTFPTLQAALDDVVRERAAVIVHRIAANPVGKNATVASYELRARAVVAAPLHETFAFFSSAENLGLLTPAGMAFSLQGAAPALQAGTTIDYRIKLGPLPVRWRTRIEQWEPERTFVDVQDEGPYKFWRHEHAFRPDGRQTIMEDRVLYTPPFGPLGRLAHRMFIAPALRRIFQYRSDTIRLRFGSPAGITLGDP
jgi:uncharacterized protein (TIGR01777 family)